ncbi:ATP-binding cassette domain-containing protein [Plantactinospora sp. B5E13]|uniref:ABC transporter ATP-binding protein n=1 Tax=unclassified Plantactinospora TaxID=2631981 RepID=UPI00325C6C0D
MTESPARGARVTIEVRGLRKRYGSKVAVDDLSFTVEPGMVTGFVGPNGAGKSTTMRIVLGLDAADAGTALVGGRPYRTLARPLRTVGALLDASAVHPGRSARNHLLWLAQSNAIPRRRVDEVLDLAGLTTVAKRTVGGFSLGMRQRLGIAAALLGDPAVIIFDEPLNGLDIEGIQWIRGLLRSLADDGRAVLISSHLMSELEDSADHLLVIGRGRLLADTTVRELVTTASGDRVAVRTGMRTEAMTALADTGALATITDGETVTVAGLSIERVVELLTRRGVTFTGVSAHRASLEEAYMELTRDAVEFGTAGRGGRAAR